MLSDMTSSSGQVQVNAVYPSSRRAVLAELIMHVLCPPLQAAYAASHRNPLEGLALMELHLARSALGV